MPLPVAPVVLSWENTQAIESTFNKVALGVGGATDRANSNVNKTRQSFPVKAIVVGQSAYVMLLAFMRSNAVSGFQLQGYLGINWTAKDINFAPLGVGVWEFTAQLEQRHRLGV